MPIRIAFRSPWTGRDHRARAVCACGVWRCGVRCAAGAVRSHGSYASAKPKRERHGPVARRTKNALA